MSLGGASSGEGPTGLALRAALGASSSAGRGDPFAFHSHPAAWAVVAGIAAAYFLLFRFGATSGGSKPSGRQLWCLAGALLSLAAALTWPIADLAAHWSLTALLAQRLLLTLAAAPLLLLSIPSPVLARLTRPVPVDFVLDFFTRPVIAVATFTVLAVGTLASPVVAAQSSSGLARAGIDAVMLIGGLVLWGPVLRNIPGAHRPGGLGTAVYLFVQSIVPTFPAVIFIFSRHPLYPAFMSARHAIGISPLADQQVAGVMAKVATLPVLWTAAWVALSRAQSMEREGKDEETLTWAEVERQLERAARAELRRHRHPQRRVRVSAIPRPVMGRWSPPGEETSELEPPPEES